jgi:hypothetical protein
MANCRRKGPWCCPCVPMPSICGGAVDRVVFNKCDEFGLTSGELSATQSTPNWNRVQGPGARHTWTRTLQQQLGTVGSQELWFNRGDVTLNRNLDTELVTINVDFVYTTRTRGRVEQEIFVRWQFGLFCEEETPTPLIFDGGSRRIYTMSNGGAGIGGGPVQLIDANGSEPWFSAIASRNVTHPTVIKSRAMPCPQCEAIVYEDFSKYVGGGATNTSLGYSRLVWEGSRYVSIDNPVFFDVTDPNGDFTVALGPTESRSILLSREVTRSDVNLVTGEPNITYIGAYGEIPLYRSIWVFKDISVNMFVESNGSSYASLDVLVATYGSSRTYQPIDATYTPETGLDLFPFHVEANWKQSMQSTVYKQTDVPVYKNCPSDSPLAKATRKIRSNQKEQINSFECFRYRCGQPSRYRPRACVQQIIAPQPIPNCELFSFPFLDLNWPNSSRYGVTRR